MPGTILVAGATGALGRHVARTLHARGWRVHALARNPARLAPLGEIVSRAHTGDALTPTSLAGAFDGVDTVFSCVGASVAPGLAGRRGYASVDVPANANLIDAARAAGVKRFVYVSTMHTPAMRRLAYVAAHERVVELLRASGMDHAVVRPTGFFSAFEAFLDMARTGVAPELGDGRARSNPIHDEDLAAVCADAVEGSEREVEAGGPEVLTRRGVLELAFEALGKKPRIVRVPLFLPRTAGVLLRPFHRRMADLAEFFAAVSAHDVVGPVRGQRTLRDFFRERSGSAPRLASGLGSAGASR